MLFALPKIAFCRPINALKSPTSVFEVPMTLLFRPFIELEIGSEGLRSNYSTFWGKSGAGGVGRGTERLGISFGNILYGWMKRRVTRVIMR